jgi:hypothetical protein
MARALGAVGVVAALATAQDGVVMGVAFLAVVLGGALWVWALQKWGR